MSKNLDDFVKLCNLKYRLKKTVESLGFENKNNALFIKPRNDYSGLYVKFDDNELSAWDSDNTRRKISKSYDIIMYDIEYEQYTESEIIKNILKLFEKGEE